jgi:hypothetical protein
MLPYEIPLNAQTAAKELKSKNLKTTTNCHTIKGVAGIQNSCPGQQ